MKFMLESSNDYFKEKELLEYVDSRVDALKSAEECMSAFKKDKNTEHLLDAMNYLMFRYMYPLPGEHYKATDSDNSVKPVGTPINMEDPYDSWKW